MTSSRPAFRLVGAPERPQLSIVVPVFNEEPNVLRLHGRLTSALDRLPHSWEIVYVDDGSRDGSLSLLRALTAADKRVVALELAHNCGQHAAVLAGFARSVGDVVITLDADLQNPPEDIARLIAAIEDGADVAAGRREDRHDPLWRRLASRAMNRVTAKLTGMRLNDWGCMLRAYRRPVVRRMLATRTARAYVPALAALFSKATVEVPVRHAPRAAGESKYDLPRLFRLHRDLVAVATTAPLWLLGVAGAACLAAGGTIAMLLALRWLSIGQEPGLVPALSGVAAIATGIQLIGLSVVGEYVGRIFAQVRGQVDPVTRIYRSDGFEEVQA